METFAMDLMNTNFYITISNSRQKNWQDKIAKWLAYVDREWSRFRDDNELAKLNRTRKGDRVQLSAPLYDALKQANGYYQLTGGLFSPYLKKQMEINGYHQSFPFARSTGHHVKTYMTKEGEHQPIVFCKDRFIVKNTTREVDLGGFAKGYAVESAARWLKHNCGAAFGLVDGGGDMAMWSDGEKEWKIGVANPFQEGKEIGIFRIKNGAAATSNRLYRSWVQGNERKHHLVNGRTGEPVVTEVVQATVVSPHLLQGEVAAKMCFFLKEEERENWFKDNFPECTYHVVKENDRKQDGT